MWSVNKRTVVRYEDSLTVSCEIDLFAKTVDTTINNAVKYIYPTTKGRFYVF